ncbi:hypothetical protein Agabi119p4_7658 [Agaricus bisporus var. burnettii]|uniref:Uncharacterized protein n=1 Tax=Agaricus bisporus var. burnettii TaxID=192524 RepID=A0A8H7C8N4_AGABI|nr:hypothetical protein Agabi119p4_7658 [Agaricus bisporus var. burnettii]
MQMGAHPVFAHVLSNASILASGEQSINRKLKVHDRSCGDLSDKFVGHVHELDNRRTISQDTQLHKKLWLLINVPNHRHHQSVSHESFYRLLT